MKKLLFAVALYLTASLGFAPSAFADSTLTLTWMQPPGYQSTLYESTNLNGSWTTFGMVNPPVTTQTTNQVAFFYVAVAPTNTTAVGNGGGGIAWQNVTGTSQQGQSNQGYIANNATQPVTITLPALPSIGDIVRVTGAGAGGWKISQNSGQSILTAAFVGKSEMTWTQTSVSNSLAWNGVAASSDGSKLVAVVFGVGIYTSTNSGLTWTQTTAPSLSWWRVASSSDGKYLYAASRGAGGIWASTNSGASWSQTTAPSTFPPYWNSVACSGDGSRVVAAQDCACYPPTASGQIWTSSNYGKTWSQATPPNSNLGFFVSISPNGQYLFAASFLGSSGIYISTTFGNSWMQTAAPASYWSAIVSSTDASIVYAAGFGVYVSTNSGGSWTPTSAPQNSNYSGLACSADGSELIGGQFSFGIWASTDSGNTWTSNNVPSASWGPVAISSNGRLLVSAQNPGGIYTASWLTTTTGTSGSLSGGQGAAVELQYVGNGTFIPISFTGNLDSSGQCDKSKEAAAQIFLFRRKPLLPIA